MNSFLPLRNVLNKHFIFMEEEQFRAFTQCPVCGVELEGIFIDQDNALVLKSEEGIEEVFLCDDGLFRFVPDEEHPELLHIDWHHNH